MIRVLHSFLEKPLIISIVVRVYSESFSFSMICLVLVLGVFFPSSVLWQSFVSLSLCRFSVASVILAFQIGKGVILID